MWGKIEKHSPGGLVTVDLNKYLVLRIKAPETNAAWKVELYNSRHCEDIRSIKPITDETGFFEYNVRDMTGWTGVTAMQITVVVEGDATKYLKIDELLFRKDIDSQALPEGIGFEENFVSLDEWTVYTGVYADVTCTQGICKITLNDPTQLNGHYGNIERDVTMQQRNITVDLNRYPVLRVKVPDTTAKWKVALLRPIPGEPDWEHCVIRGATKETGTFDMNIPYLSGWTGTTRLQVQIWINYTSSQRTDAYRKICECLLTRVQDVYPEYMPVMIPLSGSYAEWVVVKGYESSGDPLTNPGSITGFYITDPETGENEFVSISNMNSEYTTITSSDTCNGKFVVVGD